MGEGWSYLPRQSCLEGDLNTINIHMGYTNEYNMCVHRHKNSIYTLKTLPLNYTYKKYKPAWIFQKQFIHNNIHTYAVYYLPS